MKLPLKSGSRIVLSNDVHIGPEGGYTASPYFTDYIERYVPETKKLIFRESDIGYAEFESMVNEADAVEVIYEYER